MSENKPENPPSAPSAGLKPVDGVISLDDLDKVIDQMDPGFTDSLEGIKKEGVGDTAAIEALQVDSQVDVGTDDDSEKKNLRKRIFAFLMTPFVRIKGWFRLRWIAFANRCRLFKDQSIQFFKHEFPERLRFYKSRLIAGIKWCGDQIKRFMKLTKIQKIGSIVAVALIAGSGYFFFQSIKGQWLPAWRNPIMASFEKHAEFVRKTGPDDYTEFFQAFPEIEIPFLLSKIIVNLTPSPGSANPMGAFEFFLGLDAKETAIEVKDREKEVLDLVQRTVEEFTYDEVMSPVGQTRMKARIRDAINAILNQGNVTKVYINTMVTNH